MERKPERKTYGHPIVLRVEAMQPFGWRIVLHNTLHPVWQRRAKTLPELRYHLTGAADMRRRMLRVMRAQAARFGMRPAQTR